MMPTIRNLVVSASAIALSFVSPPLFAQQPGSEAPPIVLQCEAYCSPTKARTVNANIIWTDPSAVLALERNVAPVEVEQEIQTTVFKGGFDQDLYAAFPALEPTLEAAMRLTPELEQTRLPAYDLRIIGATRPQISGEGALEIMRANPQQQQSSIVVEGLEPGLNYYWRLRFNLDGEMVLSEPVMCTAPVCPADIVEERQ